MLTISDIKKLIEYVSENYIICKHSEGSSEFIELLLKEDVYVDTEE